MTKYFIFALIIIAAFIGGYKTGYQKPNIEYVHDVKPPEYIIIKPVDNSDISDLIARANSPIEVYRELDKSDLSIRATDGYKQTIVHDRFYSKQNSNFVLAGFGLDKDLSFLYTVGYIRQVLFDNLFVGGYVSFNTTSFNSFNVLCGYSF
jgi:hypothetical protein